MTGEPACRDRFGQRLRSELHMKLPQHLFQLAVNLSAPEPGVKSEGVRQTAITSFHMHVNKVATQTQ